MAGAVGLAAELLRAAIEQAQQARRKMEALLSA